MVIVDGPNQARGLFRSVVVAIDRVMNDGHAHGRVVRRSSAPGLIGAPLGASDDGRLRHGRPRRTGEAQVEVGDRRCGAPQRAGETSVASPSVLMNVKWTDALGEPPVRRYSRKRASPTQNSDSPRRRTPLLEGLTGSKLAFCQLVHLAPSLLVRTCSGGCQPAGAGPA